MSFQNSVNRLIIIIVALTVALTTVTWCCRSRHRRDTSAGADAGRRRSRFTTPLQPLTTPLHVPHSSAIRQMSRSAPRRKAVSSERVARTAFSRNEAQTAIATRPSL